MRGGKTAGLWHPGSWNAARGRAALSGGSILTLSRLAIIGLAFAVSVACATAPDAASSPLVGTTWRLLSIDGRPVLAGVTITAEFTADDRVAGSAGCNRYFGTAAPKGDRLEVGGFGSTRMFCTQDGVMAEEQAFLSAFEKVTSYSISASELRLLGGARLVFAAR